MSRHTGSSQRLTQLLLAILAVGVWGLRYRRHPHAPYPGCIADEDVAVGATGTRCRCAHTYPEFHQAPR
jgi:hypothetical protein